MTYKLLALDIDETLTTHGDSQVSPAVAEALHKAAEKLTVSFVTARAINDFQKFLDNLDLPPAYHVIENGAKVLDPQGTIVYDLTLPHDEVQEILDVTRPYFLESGFLSDKDWYNEGFTYDPDRSISGLSLTCVSEEQARLAETAIAGLPHEHAIYVGSHWDNPAGAWKGVLIFHKDATKGNGMRFVQQQLKIRKEETIAVGDGATDITMFDQAGLKVAMANGETLLKDSADVIAQSVQEDGIVKIIHTYVLEEQVKT